MTVLIFCTAIYGIYSYQQSTYRDSDITYVLTGKVTAGNGGPDDAGNHLTVNGVRVSTGGGALTTNPEKYVSDISNIHKGDQVEIRYIKDEHGNASTNCASCYVKKL